MGNLLMIFGFSWMVVAVLIGLYLGLTHDPHLEKLENIAKHGTLLQYHERLDAFKWNVTVHAHAFLFSVINVLIGLSFQKMGYSEATLTVLAAGLMASVVLWTAGGLGRSKLLMGLGDMLMLAGIVAAAIGLVKTL